MLRDELLVMHFRSVAVTPRLARCVLGVLHLLAQGLHGRVVGGPGIGRRRGRIRVRSARLLELALGASHRSLPGVGISLGQAGMDRPELDLEHELLKTRAQRAAREAEADARLDEMKKKLGRE